MRSSRLRVVFMLLCALVFAGIAVVSTVAPRTMAIAMGYTLDSVDALSEFRAIYVGLWTGHVILLATAIVRVRQALLGDLAATLILGQTAGRVLSVFLDGFPSPRVWPIFFLEALAGVALLVVRPSPPEPDEAPGAPGAPAAAAAPAAPPDLP